MILLYLINDRGLSPRLVNTEESSHSGLALLRRLGPVDLYAAHTDLILIWIRDLCMYAC